MIKIEAMISRKEDIKSINKLCRQFPVTCILGPRQCGKTTLAKQTNYKHYFDLENPRDIARLDAPQSALENLQGLIVIDEIQKKPDLFSLLRYLVDSNPKQHYLILGSASRDLIQQSSETLAGRIAYYQLDGFNLDDVGDNDLNRLWLRGGFPNSFLARSNDTSVIWRDNYITTFLERDIPQLGINIPANTLRRFWIMLSHYHGQVLNYSELARSFGISDMTVRKYLDILSGTFMILLLQPWFNNTKKRLVKSPKLYLCDSGIFHTLQGIESFFDLQRHPKLGASWEGFALQQVLHLLALSSEKVFFWSTHTGAEVDLFWMKKGKNFAVEFKYADAPTVTKSMQSAINDLKLHKLWVIYPGNQAYQLERKIHVLPMTEIHHLR